jgi:hypothetical protein
MPTFGTVGAIFARDSKARPMRQHFFKIGRFLLGRFEAQRFKSDDTWFNRTS